jgi:hypothetical protein
MLGTVLSPGYVLKHGIKTAAVSFSDEGGMADTMVIRGVRQDSQAIL